MEGGSTCGDRAEPDARSGCARADAIVVDDDANLMSDEGDAHRPGDSAGVPAPLTALFPSVEGTARPRTAP